MIFFSKISIQNVQSKKILLVFGQLQRILKSQSDQIDSAGKAFGGKVSLMRYLAHKILHDWGKFQDMAKGATIPTRLRQIHRIAKTFAEGKNPGRQSQAPHKAYWGQHQTVECELEALGTVGLFPMCLELYMLHCKAERNVVQDKRLGLRYSKTMLLDSSSVSTWK